MAEMIPWIQIYSNLPQHRKTAKLAEELKLSSAAVEANLVAVGLLVGLWTWAIQNAYDGNLSDCSPRTIANACQWKKKPETLVQALIKTGWLNEDLRLHDWEEYALLLIDQEENRRQKTRERVRRYRDRKSGNGGAAGNAAGNVTAPRCNAPTLPDQTLPDPTKPDLAASPTTSVVCDAAKRGAVPPAEVQAGFSPPLQSALESWLRYKAEKRQDYRPEGLKALVGEIRSNAARYGEDAVIGLIGKCMSSNWQGIIWDRLKKAEAESGSWHYDPGSMEGSL